MPREERPVSALTLFDLGRPAYVDTETPMERRRRLDRERHIKFRRERQFCPPMSEAFTPTATWKTCEL